MIRFIVKLMALLSLPIFLLFILFYGFHQGIVIAIEFIKGAAETIEDQLNQIIKN